MTFFIPPVFLFGNNANRLHNNEEEKSEYKTAAEIEIKVENWRVKRIAELEEKNKKLNEKVRFLEECLDRKEKLNKKLREELGHYKNTEAIQKSNDASRYNPYNHKSYVDREFNVIP